MARVEDIWLPKVPWVVKDRGDDGVHSSALEDVRARGLKWPPTWSGWIIRAPQLTVSFTYCAALQLGTEILKLFCPIWLITVPSPPDTNHPDTTSSRFFGHFHDLSTKSFTHSLAKASKARYQHRSQNLIWCLVPTGWLGTMTITPMYIYATTEKNDLEPQPLARKYMYRILLYCKKKTTLTHTK